VSECATAALHELNLGNVCFRWHVYYNVMKYRSIALVCGVIQLAVTSPALAQRTATTTDTLRLSLEEAVTTGLRIADEVRLSAAQADMADAQVDAARASLVPQLRLNASYARTY
jgi:outer membrane protein TolC